MSIQEVQGAKEAQIYQKKVKAEGGEGFQKSLLQNLRSREREEASADFAQEDKRTKELSEAARIGVTGSVRVNAAMLTEAVQTARVRYMRYEESDRVEIAVTEGYILKGKRLDDTEDSWQEQNEKLTEVSELLESQEAVESKAADTRKGCRVYVEAKYEDGRTEAYRVELNRVSENTTHIIERFALETMRET